MIFLTTLSTSTALSVPRLGGVSTDLVTAALFAERREACADPLLRRIAFLTRPSSVPLLLDAGLLETFLDILLDLSENCSPVIINQ
jgi:hypothetical protein